jgi:dynein heavy chain
LCEITTDYAITSVVSIPQDEVLLAKRRYEIGLDKLQTTEESVSGMKEELIALQPQLEVRTTV